MADIMDFLGKDKDGSWLYGGPDGSLHIKPEKGKELTIAQSLFLLECCKIQILKSADILPYNYPTI